MRAEVVKSGLGYRGHGIGNHCGNTSRRAA